MQTTRPGTRQRSKRCVAISLVLMGSGAAGLSTAQEAPQPAVWRSVEHCVQGGSDRARCEDSWREARAQHAKTAPTFDNLAKCEAEYGAGKCEKAPEQEAHRSGGFFMPMMMGYMMGSMLGGRGGSAQALYQKPGQSGLVDARGTRVAQPQPARRASPAARQDDDNQKQQSSTRRGGFGTRGARASS